MSSHNDIDERFDDLVRELRSGHTAASSELRERVHAIVAEAPAPKVLRASWRDRFPVRKAGLVLVPACLVAAGSFALLQGLTSSGTREVHGQSISVTGKRDDGSSTYRARKDVPSKPVDSLNAAAPKAGLPATGSSSESGLAPPPSSRLQDYRVSMRVRLSSLNGLSSAVVQAMRVTRSLGGYVANVEYSSPNVRHGDAVLLLRVPINNVQKAVMTYAGLGALVAQHFTVLDVQKQYDAEVERVAKLRFQIAKLNAQIVSGNLSEVDLANAKEQLEYARYALKRSATQKRTTLNHARLSTVRLSFTTFHPKKKHAVPAVPSRFDRSLTNAGHVLGREAMWALYGLVVAGPLALFALMLLAAAGSRRRRSERRLLAATR
jgi:hypothetical protein